MSDGGGGQDQLAPVIPLFGRTAPRGASTDDGSPEAVPPSRTEPAETVPPESAEQGRTGDAPGWKSTWSDVGPENAVNPVASLDTRGPSDRHPAHGTAARSAPRLRALHATEGTAVDDQFADLARVREAAEELLVRKLRSRSLSIAEARTVLRGYEHDGTRLDSSAVDDVLDDFSRRGYLDDALLAEQLVTSGIERKGQGRVALSRALSQRGIPRDVIAAALDEAPDDDAERALEYARTKARGLSRLDSETALRRLVGQLSRRGYNGSVAMAAAKTALAEVSFGQPSSGVRFVDSD